MAVRAQGAAARHARAGHGRVVQHLRPAPEPRATRPHGAHAPQDPPRWHCPMEQQALSTPAVPCGAGAGACLCRNLAAGLRSSWGEQKEEERRAAHPRVTCLSVIACGWSRQAKNFVLEAMIPPWMDLVVWGHEHECKPNTEVRAAPPASARPCTCAPQRCDWRARGPTALPGVGAATARVSASAPRRAVHRTRACPRWRTRRSSCSRAPPWRRRCPTGRPSASTASCSRCTAPAGAW